MMTVVAEKENFQDGCSLRRNGKGREEQTPQEGRERWRFEESEEGNGGHEMRRSIMLDEFECQVIEP
jgi:hypothetical protein